MNHELALSPVLAGVGPIGPIEMLLLLIVVFPIWPAWRLCGKVDWPGPCALFLFVPLANIVFVVTLFARALPRAGLTAWLAILALLPFVGLVMLFALAFSRWPGGAAEAR